MKLTEWVELWPCPSVYPSNFVITSTRLLNILSDLGTNQNNGTSNESALHFKVMHSRSKSLFLLIESVCHYCLGLSCVRFGWNVVQWFRTKIHQTDLQFCGGQFPSKMRMMPDFFAFSPEKGLRYPVFSIDRWLAPFFLISQMQLRTFSVDCLRLDMNWPYYIWHLAFHLFIF